MGGSGGSQRSAVVEGYGATERCESNSWDGSWLLAAVEEVGLAQVELALDAAAALVRELAGAEQLVELVAFRRDELELDVRAQVGQLAMRGVAIAAVVDIAQ